MKRILIAIAVLFSISLSAQNYNDSLISIQGTQRMAWYVGFHIKQQSVWSDRTAPATLKNYVGSGNNQDSVFNVTLKASYIKGLIDLLLGGQNEVVQADRLAVLNNSPVNPNGYTALTTQILNKAAGNTSEKLVAQFIIDYYTERVAAFAALRTENKNSVIAWANN